jgi:hypothetical protein
MLAHARVDVSVRLPATATRLPTTVDVLVHRTLMMAIMFATFDRAGFMRAVHADIPCFPRYESRPALMPYQGNRGMRDRQGMGCYLDGLSMCGSAT